jgi:hypothetical protein
LSKQVVVMIDPSDVSTLAESLKHLLGKKTYTPQPEVLFEVEYVLPGSSDAVVRRKNLILTGAIDGESPGGQLVRNVLDAEEQEKVRLGEIGVVIKHDVWAKDQLVVIVSGQDKEDVKDWMQLEHDRIYRALEGSLDAWLAGLLYRKGENQALTDTLFRRFGWQVQVPSEFRMLDENADQNFVVFSRAISGRRVWVSVYWENGVSPDVLTAEWCLEKRDEISRRFLGEDRVIPEGAEAYEVELGGKLAVCLEGLWENTQSWHGGPFRSYALVDVDQERLYFLDAGVFAPNKTKALHLRQLDGLVRTFRVDPFFKKKWIDSGPTTREKVRR